MAYTTIDDPSDYFNTKLYTGNATNPTTISGIGFQPDWVWTKGRSTAEGHRWCDSVRGATKDILSNTTSVESTNAIGLKSFNSDGYVIGNSNGYNKNTETFVSWNWLAGTSVSGTTTGSGTGKAYSGSVSTTAGFSIIKYLGNGAAGHTIPHHLGAVPEWILVKQTIGGTENWFSYHVSLGNTKDIHLNQTNAGATADSWNDTTPTSSVFSISDQSAVNGDGNTHVAYCFAEKQGYSKFGSYAGNGNANGTFVYTGFRVGWVMIKRTNGSNGWYIYDSTRDPLNQNTKALLAAESDAEQDESGMDLLSNGFKLRNTDGSKNGSGNSYIYMAFAESPFVNSKGVPATAR